MEIVKEWIKKTNGNCEEIEENRKIGEKSRNWTQMWRGRDKLEIYVKKNNSQLTISVFGLVHKRNYLKDSPENVMTSKHLAYNNNQNHDKRSTIIWLFPLNYSWFKSILIYYYYLLNDGSRDGKISLWSFKNMFPTLEIIGKFE